MDEQELPPSLAFLGIKGIAEQIVELANLYQTPEQQLRKTLSAFGEQLNVLKMIADPSQHLLDNLIATLPRLDITSALGNPNAVMSFLGQAYETNFLAPSAIDKLTSSLGALSFNPELQEMVGLQAYLASQQPIYGSVTKLSTLMGSDVFKAALPPLNLEHGFETATANFLRSLTIDNATELRAYFPDSEELDATVAALDDALPFDKLPETIRSKATELNDLVRREVVPPVVLFTWFIAWLELAQDRSFSAAFDVATQFLAILIVLNQMLKEY